MKEKDDHDHASCDSATRSQDAGRVTWVGLFLNLFLTFFKFASGILGRSGAMTADAVHSASDLITDAAVIIGFKQVGKPPDDCHDYGHGKYETFITLFVGAMLALAGALIIFEAGGKILSAISGEILGIPRPIALIAAIVSLVLKEAMYHYTVHVGKRIGSDAIIANAWHHRTDALTSVAALFGISISILFKGRFAIFDPIAALFVGIFIIVVSVRFIKSSTSELLEASLDNETKERIVSLILSVPGIENPHSLKTRRIGKGIAIDVHVCVSPGMTVELAHSMTKDIEKVLKKEFGTDTYVIVHVCPMGQEHSP
ncbi:MAG: cation diffusion facilitator family transporter [Candidatus Thermoplasmatota archaeon]|nr:cation diffusion facilitator family transporter [Candidatus Thermoplasmatota archaeon]